MLLYILGFIVVVVAVYTIYKYNKKKEAFTEIYLANMAVDNNPPPMNAVFTMPGFLPANDPRSQSQGVQGVRGGPAAPASMMAYPTYGGAPQYSEKQMIELGGCAGMCGDGANYCKAANCPMGKDYPQWATGATTPSAASASSYAKGPKLGSIASKSKQLTEDLKELRKTEKAFGRLATYDEAVKTELMLPKPDLAANVDPSQYVVYDRNMGSMMMKSGNRVPPDHIRGDVIPITKNCTPTLSARIGDPDSPMFVPRYASDIGTLQRGYFTNYNDITQVLDERNASYFMSKAQALRTELRNDSGMGLTAP